MRLGILLSIVLAAPFGLPAQLQSQDSQPPSAPKRLISRFEKGKLATNPTEWGTVTFDSAQIQSPGAPPEDVQAIQACIRRIWKAWIKQNKTGYLAQASDDVTLISQQVGKKAEGHREVAALLAEEWNAYERPAGTIAMKVEIRQCELEIAKGVAWSQYWMRVDGGARWGFKDLVLVCQFFIKRDGQWKLAYHTDSWGLAYNLQDNKPGKRTFDFDYAYPVKDLARALKFYTPLLGKPEVVTDTRATFMLEGHRFHLDTSTLNGHAEVENRFPCGYAIFYTADLQTELRRLKTTTATIVQGIKQWGSDTYVICEDPSENIFVIMQKTPDSLPTKPPQLPTVTISGQPTGYVKHSLALKNVMQAWLTMDLAAIDAHIDSRTRWFDDTRSQIDGVYVGPKAIAAGLKKDWQTYDRSPAGLTADMDIGSPTVKTMGKWTVICYHRRLTGKGRHPFQETAWVSQVFDNKTERPRLASSYIIRANNTNAPVKELDYTGYPVSALRPAEKFYTQILELGTPYRDAAYRGYWSNNAVFGIYTAKLQRDRLPRPHKTNGYVSFWINSAKETHAYLDKQGTTFLKIPAINTRVGIDSQPGYTQILTTDSEGNAVLFTEYPGN